tara:strand:+ start:360 stop:836 length:477 start_codon:yes stop_codon:yes gene_type:complete
MITGVYGSTITAYLTLEEKRIDTAKATSKVQYLFKFTNDMTKTVKYCYARKTTHNDRYVKCEFLHNTSEDPFTYKIDFKPYGFWKYEVYEVTWIGDVSLSSPTAPDIETEVLVVNDERGVVKGKVEEGKVLIQETSGSEQVRYTEHTETTTNYLYTDY